jgi:hypothetical protein
VPPAELEGILAELIVLHRPAGLEQPSLQLNKLTDNNLLLRARLYSALRGGGRIGFRAHRARRDIGGAGAASQPAIAEEFAFARQLNAAPVKVILPAPAGPSYQARRPLIAAT